MANLPEVAQWGAEEDGIYQLELVDFITGGAGGNDNEPHRILGNRTRWLKARYTELSQTLNGINFSAFATITQLNQAISSLTPTIGAWQDLTLAGSFTGYFRIRETIFNSKVRLVEIEASLNHPSVTAGSERNITQIPIGFRPQKDTSLIFYKMGGLYPYAYNGFILMDYDGSVAVADQGKVGIKFHGGDAASRYKAGTSYFIVEGV